MLPLHWGVVPPIVEPCFSPMVLVKMIQREAKRQRALAVNSVDELTALVLSRLSSITSIRKRTFLRGVERQRRTEDPVMLAIIIPIGRNNAQGSTIAGIDIGIGFGAPISKRRRSDTRIQAEYFEG
jgi:hypothetical protein